MKEETTEKIAAAVAQWEYLNDLPQEWFGFQLRQERRFYDDIYDIFSYANEAQRRKITIYYHDETKEYKLRVTAGLTEFCKEDFIAANIEALEKVLRERFERTLDDLAVFRPERIDSLVVAKKILDWRYLDKFPETIAGFTLFIKPDAPFRSINGSYIVFDYSDFVADSNFIVYYNIFRDEFFGEAQIKKIPTMNYLFDSHELADLEEKLDLHLVERLQDIRAKLNEA